MGKVALVGAGCGNLDLYTVRAIELISTCDCLVYDSLIDNEIIEKTKEDCERIFVGKRANHHALPQEEINQLLVNKSKEYALTVRLKGGDVYVFGRGGEEGEELFKNQVEFEVVPGVSSCTGGLAYAGIPITHRGVSGGFQVYTSQLRSNQEREFDFTMMLDDYCTYVFLMGIRKLEMIVNGFLEAGKHPKTPIAIVSNASLAKQRTLVSTLDCMVEDFNNHPLPMPGIIVVGNVVNMRQYLNFFETKPLFGENILVTVVGNDHMLTKALRQQGANVQEVQTGSIEYVDIELPSLEGTFVFTSKHGVIGFMKAYKKQYQDVRKLANVKIVAIGEKTNACLQEYGLCADMIPSDWNSDSLQQECALDDAVWFTADIAHAKINCKKKLIVYRNVECTIMEEIGHYDYALFTCASSVERFKKQNDSSISTFISIGKFTTKAVKACYGDVNIIETNVASKEAMLECLIGGVKDVL